MMPRLVFITLLACVIFAKESNATPPCNMLDYKPDDYGVIFEGKVKATAPFTIPDKEMLEAFKKIDFSPEDSAVAFVTIFETNKFYKGQQEKFLSIVHSKTFFEEGKTYFVFSAFNDRNFLALPGGCNPTTIFENAKAPYPFSQKVIEQIIDKNKTQSE